MMLSTIDHWEFWQIFMCRWFWCGAGGWIIASIIKMLIAARKTKRFDFEYLFSTGGMPSSHSACVTALSFGIGYTEGFDTPITTLAMAFAVITMFDAATVRHAAGEHAKVLNAIMADIKEFSLKPIVRLKELLGHTRTEVFWGMITGVVWATLLCYFW